MLKLTNIPTEIKVLVKEPGKNSKSVCVSFVAGATLRRGPRATAADALARGHGSLEARQSRDAL